MRKRNGGQKKCIYFSPFLATSDVEFKVLVFSFDQILIQSVYETVVPKLVAEDIPLLQSLLSDVFPGVKYVGAEMKKLKAEIKKVCNEMNLVFGEGEEQGGAWVEKVSALKKLFWRKKKTEIISFLQTNLFRLPIYLEAIWASKGLMDV